MDSVENPRVSYLFPDRWSSATEMYIRVSGKHTYNPYCGFSAYVLTLSFKTMCCCLVRILIPKIISLEIFQRSIYIMIVESRSNVEDGISKSMGYDNCEIKYYNNSYLIIVLLC